MDWKSIGNMFVASFPYILAVFFVAGFFSTFHTLMTTPIPPETKNVVFTMAGILGTGTITILNFYFGSSKGSSDKTKILASKDKV